MKQSMPIDNAKGNPTNIDKYWRDEIFRKTVRDSMLPIALLHNNIALSRILWRHVFEKR